MTSIGEVAGLLGEVRALASDALSRVREGEELWLDAAADLIQVLVGSEMVEVGELARLDDEVRRRFTDLGELLADVSDRLEAIQARLVGAGAVDPATEPVFPPAVLARDGSHYPAASAWCADFMPPRVIIGTRNQKTVGYVAESAVPFHSGLDDVWTPAVARRMVELRIGSIQLVRVLRSHVEMKVATMMIAEGRKNCELTINHAPCPLGTPMQAGCDSVLERYLPKGYTLTVHGTTQEGGPYSKTYWGRA